MSAQLVRMTPEIARLLERQLRRWELARGQRFGVTPPRKQVFDFVTLSRQVGAGGFAVSARVGELLGWPVFSQELLHAMAGDSLTRQHIFEQLDERDHTWLEELLGWLLIGKYTPDDYFPRMTRTVLSLARRGPGVFLGRGVDLILPRDHGLRVRLVASEEIRVARFAERMGLDDAAAREHMKRIERERTDFLRHHFRPVRDPFERFDLTINTGRTPQEEAAEVIVEAMRLRSRRQAAEAQVIEGA